MKQSIKGKVEYVGKTESFGQKGFTKRTLVVDNGFKFPNPVPFTFTKDNCSLLDEVAVGEEVEVEFHINGRKWNAPNGDVRYFVELTGVSVRSVKYGRKDAPPSAVPSPELNLSSDDEMDDVPF